MVDEELSELCSCSPASRPLGAGLSLSLFDDGRQKPTAVNDCQYQDELLARDIAVNDPVVAYQHHSVLALGELGDNTATFWEISEACSGTPNLPYSNTSITLGITGDELVGFGGDPRWPALSKLLEPLVAQFDNLVMSGGVTIRRCFFC